MAEFFDEHRRQRSAPALSVLNSAEDLASVPGLPALTGRTVSAMLERPELFPSNSDRYYAHDSAYACLLGHGGAEYCRRAQEFAAMYGLSKGLALCTGPIRAVIRDECSTGRMSNLLLERVALGVDPRHALVSSLCAVLPAVPCLSERRRAEYMARGLCAAAVLGVADFPDIVLSWMENQPELVVPTCRAALRIAEQNRRYSAGLTGGSPDVAGETPVDREEFLRSAAVLLRYWKQSARAGVARVWCSGGAFWLAAEGSLPFAEMVSLTRRNPSSREFSPDERCASPAAVVALLGALGQWSVEADSLEAGATAGAGGTGTEARRNYHNFVRWIAQSAQRADYFAPDRLFTLTLLRHLLELPRAEGLPLLSRLLHDRRFGAHVAEGGAIDPDAGSPRVQQLFSTLRWGLDTIRGREHTDDPLVRILSHRHTLGRLWQAPEEVTASLVQIDNLLGQWGLSGQWGRAEGPSGWLDDLQMRLISQAAEGGLEPPVAKLLAQCTDDETAKVFGEHWLQHRYSPPFLSHCTYYAALIGAANTPDDLAAAVRYTSGRSAPFEQECARGFAESIGYPFIVSAFVAPGDVGGTLLTRLVRLSRGLNALREYWGGEPDVLELFCRLAAPEAGCLREPDIEFPIFADFLDKMGMHASPKLFHRYRREKLAEHTSEAREASRSGGAVSRYALHQLRSLCVEDRPFIPTVPGIARDILEQVCHLKSCTYGSPGAVIEWIERFPALDFRRRAAREAAFTMDSSGLNKDQKRQLAAYQSSLSNAEEAWNAFRTEGPRTVALPTRRIAEVSSFIREKPIDSWLDSMHNLWQIGSGSPMQLKFLIQLLKRTGLGIEIPDPPVTGSAGPAALSTWQRELLVAALCRASELNSLDRSDTDALSGLLLRVAATSPKPNEERPLIHYNYQLPEEGKVLLWAELGARIFDGDLAERLIFREQPLSGEQKARCLQTLRRAIRYDELMGALESFETRNPSHCPADEVSEAESCSLTIVPTRALLRDLCGYVCNTCFADDLDAFSSTQVNPNRADDGRPNIVFLAFVKDFAGPHPKLVGGTLVISAHYKNSEGQHRPAFMLRALNPREEFVRTVYPGALLDEVIGYVLDVGARWAGDCAVTLPKDPSPFAALTNSPAMFYCARRDYFGGEALMCGSDRTTTIKGQRAYNKTIRAHRRRSGERARRMT